MAATSSPATLAADETFGPQLLDKFDFTLLFQHVILTLLPSALLILASPVYAYYHAQRAVVNDAGWILWAKFVTVILLIGTEITTTVLWGNAESYNSNIAIVAASVACVGTASVLIMVFIEHRYSYRPSSLLATFLFLTMLFDIVKARTHFTRTQMTAIAALCLVAICLKSLLIILGEFSKRSLIRDSKKKKSCSEETVSGFWNRALFIWLNKMLLVGFKRDLEVKDLPELEPEFDSATLYNQLQSRWNKVDQRGSHALLKSCVWAFWQDMTSVIIPKLLYSAFTFAQPFLIQTTLRYLGRSEKDYNIAGALIAATFLVFAGRSVTRSISDHLIFRSITKLRGALVGMVLNKCLKLETRTAQDMASVSIMSTDVESLEPAIVLFHNTWSGCVNIAVGFYILSSMIGQSSFLAALPTVFAFIITFPWTLKLIPARKVWQEAIQVRVAETSKLLSQIKGVKMTGLSQLYFKYLQRLRRQEISASKSLRKVSMLLYSISVVADVSTPTLVLAGGVFWSGFSGGFNAVSVFPVLSVVSIVVKPVVALLNSLPGFTGAFACLSRIQNFLLLEEREDRRIIGSIARRTRPVCLSAELPFEEKLQSHGVGVGLVNHNHPLDCAISFQSVTVKYHDDEKGILKEVSFQLCKGDLVFVVGPVASGKSTLLQTIIGEVNFPAGSVYVHNPHIAYCGQSPWLQNLTIQQSIIGYRSFEPAWYLTILQACCIDPRQFRNGDQTQIGSGGVNVSGGQKQRIALARALYARPSTIVVDNPFSSLDATTSRLIFNNLFAKETGLLRRMGVTVVMSTSAIEYLGAAEQILVLDGQGGVQNCKSLLEFSKISQSIPSLELINESSGEECEAGGKELGSPGRLMTPTSAHSSESVTDSAPNQAKSHKVGDWSSWRFIFRAVPLSTNLIWFGLLLIAAILVRFPDIYVRVWLEKDPGNKSWYAGLPASCFAFFVLHTAFYWHYFLAFVPRLAFNLHDMLLATIMRSKLQHITSKDTGSILNKFSQDMSLVNTQLPNNLMQVLLFTFFILVSIGVICSGANYIAAVIPILIAVLLAITYYYLKTSRQMRHLDLEGKTPLYTHFSDATAGLQHIRAFGYQEDFIQDGMAKLDCSQRPYYYMFCIQRWLTLVLDLVVMALAVLVETFALKFAQDTSQSATGLSLLNLLSFAEQLQWCVIAWTAMETCLGAISRLQSIIRNTPCEDELTPPNSLPHNWPTTGSVSMKGVEIYYSNEQIHSYPILSDVSYDITPGTRVSVSGRTGSGKSSLMLALLNLIDRKGAIEVDGYDPRDLPPQLVRSRIAVIPQDPVMLPGTVRDNIVPPDLAVTRPSEDPEIIMVLEALQIWEYIRTHGGLSVEYDKMSFSHGQKQLVALARAILHNRVVGTRIVIMDEATSHLDNATDEQVQRYLTGVFEGCTVFNITHRENGFPDADYVLNLANGKASLTSLCSERDTHLS